MPTKDDLIGLLSPELQDRLRKLKQQGQDTVDDLALRGAGAIDDAATAGRNLAEDFGLIQPENLDRMIQQSGQSTRGPTHLPVTPPGMRDQRLEELLPFMSESQKDALAKMIMEDFKRRKGPLI